MPRFLVVVRFSFGTQEEDEDVSAGSPRQPARRPPHLAFGAVGRPADAVGRSGNYRSRGQSHPARAPTAHPAAIVASADVGPTISSVVASTVKGELTCNAADPSGVESSGLTVNGVAIMDVKGPWTASTGWNYSWSFNSLGSGTDTYVITATDNNGNVSQYTRAFRSATTPARRSTRSWCRRRKGDHLERRGGIGRGKV